MRSSLLRPAALAFALAGPVLAQPPCTVSGLTPTVRSEGVAELIGDIILRCSGATGNPAATDIRIALNTSITNGLPPGATSPLIETDARLLIDEPTNPVLGQSLFWGERAGFNAIVFRNVPAPQPGAERTYRITDVRANAAILGPGASVHAFPQLGPNFPPGGGPPTSLFVSPAIPVGAVRRSVNFSVPQGATFRDCQAGTSAFRLRFEETFPSAFRRANREKAPSGTKLRAVMNNMPFGTFEVVGGNRGSSSLQTRFVAPGAVQPNGNIRLQPVNNSIIAEWEVTDENQTAAETAEFLINLTTTSGGRPDNSPPVGRFCAAGFFGNISDATLSPAPPPIPRFVDTTSARSLLGLGQPSNFAFPFISTEAGFDTGLVISNTSQDNFGSGSGRCSLDGYGGFSPSPYGGPHPFAEVQNCSPGGFSLNIAGPSLQSPHWSFFGYPGVSTQRLSQGYLALILGQDGAGSGVRATVDGIATSGTMETRSDWLNFGVTSATTPSALTLRPDPTGLAPGTYRKTISVTSGDGQSQSRTVEMVVPPLGPLFERAGVTHAGSGTPGFVTPGLATVIYGRRFGPSALATLQLAGGRVATTIGDTRILFDGEAAPMIYAIDGQVSCFAPFSLATKQRTRIQVEYRGQRSPEVTVPVLAQSPSLLTYDSSGSGQVAALNQDGSLNTPGNGAALDSVMTFFGTGGGTTTPPSVDGQVGGPPNAVFAVPMTAEIDGQAAQILYQGPAPSLAAGVFQLNARVPSTARPGPNRLVVIRQGSQVSAIGNTISIRP